MTSKLLRGLLNAIAIELVIAWAIVTFFVAWAGWFLVAAMCLFLMTGFMAFCDKQRADAEYRRANPRPEWVKP